LRLVLYVLFSFKVLFSFIIEAIEIS